MNKELISYQQAALAPVGNLSSYIHWVNRIPMLTADEEHQLATRLREHKDLDAARKLVMSHLRLVVKIARGYDGYGLSQSDLIQEGNIGLMKAVKRFDPNVGVRLVSFAIHWIRAEIHEFVLRNWRIVKIATTKAQRKLFFNLRKMSKKRGWFSPTEVETIAEELSVKKKDVQQMEARLNAYDESLEFYDSDDDNAWQAPINYLEDKSANPATVSEKEDWSDSRDQLLYEALDNLDDRSRDIVASRWLAEKKATLHDLAAKYNISAERVRQLEQAAMGKLRGHIAA